MRSQVEQVRKAAAAWVAAVAYEEKVGEGITGHIDEAVAKFERELGVLAEMASCPSCRNGILRLNFPGSDAYVHSYGGHLVPCSSRDPLT